MSTASYKTIENPFKSLPFLLVALGLFFIPFNSYVGISFLGEFSKESCFIFFMLAFFVQVYEIILKKTVRIPHKHPLFLMLMGIMTWFLLTYFLNIIDIQNYFIKQTSGNKRFIKQYGALVISAILLFLTYYNAFCKFTPLIVFKAIRKVLLYAFVVVSIYTVIEIFIIYFKLRFLTPVLYLFDYFPFTEAWVDTRLNRVSSVTFEPPAFATYLTTVAGWMFSYIITHKGFKAFIPTLLVILFSVFSGSRAGLVIIIIQLFCFLLYFIKRRHYHQTLIKFALLLFFISIPILIYQGKNLSNYLFEKLTSFNLKDDTHSTSNKSRFGIIYTSGIIFSQNPIKGVGFGQQAYEARDLYPNWATKNNWEFKLKYKNDNIKSFPPGYNIYARILAETGLLGFFLFMLFLFICCYICYKKMKIDSTHAWFYVLLFVSFVGFALNWLKSDTFRIFGFWICLALLVFITPQLKLRKND